MLRKLLKTLAIFSESICGKAKERRFPKVRKCILFASSLSSPFAPMVSPHVPIDLEGMVDFLFEQETARKWIFSSSNKLFTTALGSDGVESIIISEADDGAWKVLPSSWREYFEKGEFGQGGRDRVLEDLARSVERVRICHNFLRGGCLYSG